jgi:hypothetical protein
MRRVQIAQWALQSVQQTIDRLVDVISTTVEGRVKATSSDTTSQYLDDKMSLGRGLERTILNPGAIELYELSSSQFAQELVVDPSGDFDDTSIASAISTAIAAGASATNPYVVSVKPGTYTEPPMTLPDGVSVVARSNRIDTVFVHASNPDADLFTCEGGGLSGLCLCGVTNATKALVRIPSGNFLTANGLRISNCSTGIAIEGSQAILTNFAVEIDGPNQAITTAISLTGATGKLRLLNSWARVPANVLPLYPGVNPLQTYVSVEEGQAFVGGCVCGLSHNVNDNVGFLIDNGGEADLFSTDVRNAYYATYIGTNGSDSRLVVQGGSFVDNDWNGYANSATALVQVSAETDEIKFFGVAGAELNGLIQLATTKETLIAGDSEYLYATNKKVNFGEFLHDFGSTGSTYDSGEVTDAGGLDVDVAAGEGYCSRHAPEHDIETVTWDSDTLTLADDTTNYVYYDPVTESLTSGTASPGVDKILLATVETLSGDIIYLHDSRQDVHQPAQEMHDYLMATRRIAWDSGLGISVGTGANNLDVSSGSWYRAWRKLEAAGGSDITWAYYYGSGAGLTRVSGVSSVDSGQYDNAGVLTTLAGGEYKADTLVITSDNRFTMFYGNAKFATQALAEDVANKATIPDFLSDTACYVALVVSAGNGGAGTVVSYVDIRPDPNAATSGTGGGAAADHSALANLNADDHTQYLRTDGARALTGSLDVGGNDIGNVGTVDGVTVSAHAARHNAGGADELAAATVATNGFMSAADKTKLDSISAPSYAEIYLSTPTTQAGLSAAPSQLTTFDTNGVAVDSTANEANNRIVVGTTGNYKASFHVTFDGANNVTAIFQINVNGTPVVNGSAAKRTGSAAWQGQVAVDCLLALTAADLVTVEVAIDTGTSLNIDYCALSIQRL